MIRLIAAIGYARRLLWLLEALVDAQVATMVLLSHPQVARWLEKQSEEEQKKIRESAPLVMGAIIASLR